MKMVNTKVKYVKCPISACCLIICIAIAKAEHVNNHAPSSGPTRVKLRSSRTSEVVRVSKVLPAPELTTDGPTLPCQQITCTLECRNDEYAMDENGCTMCKCQGSDSRFPPIPCPMMSCYIDCINDEYGKDENGCDVCACQFELTGGDPKESCPQIACTATCSNSAYAKDENGCTMCKCQGSESLFLLLGCPMVACSIDCLNDEYEQDETGCDMCACQIVHGHPAGFSCPMLMCDRCPHGSVKDVHDCDTCQCVVLGHPGGFSCPMLMCDRCPHGSVKDVHDCDTCQCVELTTDGPTLPCQQLACTLECRNDEYAMDENGCTMCKCQEVHGHHGGFSCPMLMCDRCPHGSVKDVHDCDTCQCVVSTTPLKCATPPQQRDECTAALMKWSYIHETDTCELMQWGGCASSDLDNRFESLSDCDMTCKRNVSCSPVMCRIHCEHGFKQDMNGCELCICKVPMPSAQTACEWAVACFARASEKLASRMSAEHEAPLSQTCNDESPTQTNNPLVSQEYGRCTLLNLQCSDEKIHSRMMAEINENNILFRDMCRNQFKDQYQGCYKSYGLVPQFSGPALVHNEMTVEACIIYCRTQLRRPFAGIVNGVECFCGSRIDTRHAVTSLDCYSDEALACPGDTDMTCGAPSAMSIYRVCPLDKTGVDCSRTCRLCGNRGCRSGNKCLGSCDAGYSSFLSNTCRRVCTGGMYGPDCRYSCAARCADSKCDPRYGRCLNGCKDNTRGGQHCRSYHRDVISLNSPEESCESKIFRCIESVKAMLTEEGIDPYNVLRFQEEYCASYFRASKGMRDAVQNMIQCVADEFETCEESDHTTNVLDSVSMVAVLRDLCMPECDDIESKVNKTMQCLPEDIRNVERRTLGITSVCLLWNMEGLAACLEEQSSCCLIPINIIKRRHAITMGELESDVFEYCPEVETAMSSVCEFPSSMAHQILSSGAGKLSVLDGLLVVVLGGHALIGCIVAY